MTTRTEAARPLVSMSNRSSHASMEKNRQICHRNSQDLAVGGVRPEFQASLNLGLTPRPRAWKPQGGGGRLEVRSRQPSAAIGREPQGFPGPISGGRFSHRTHASRPPAGLGWSSVPRPMHSPEPKSRSFQITMLTDSASRHQRGLTLTRRRRPLSWRPGLSNGFTGRSDLGGISG